jgi:hypothetical protein
VNGLTKAAVQGAACGLMIGFVLLIGVRVWHPVTVAAQTKQPDVADEVRARRFVLVSAEGYTQGVLSITSVRGPALSLFDTAGRMRASLGGSTLAFSDAAGKLRVDLGLSSSGRPMLILSDAAEMPRAILGAVALGSVKTGKNAVRAESSLVLVGKDGRTIWQAP